MNHQVRLFATSVKQSIAHAYATGGTAFGLEASRRTLWEIGDFMADVHGHDAASKALYRVADTVAVGAGVEEVWPPKVTPVEASAEMRERPSFADLVREMSPHGIEIGRYGPPASETPMVVGIDIASGPDMSVITIVGEPKADPSEDATAFYLVRNLAQLVNEALAENWFVIAAFTALWGFFLGRG